MIPPCVYQFQPLFNYNDDILRGEISILYKENTY